jgi:phosphoribosylamine--glycine ligase
VVGPELPLVLGIGNVFEQRGLRIFGPNREAAKLEGSKAFAKEIMLENGIPTAACEVFESLEKARNYVRRDAPCVVKADGLAAGKGVIICNGKDDAEAALDQIMRERVFGPAGDRVIIEERLVGEEASFMALVDGEHFLPLASAQDHKRVFDGDEGLNTGGMGAYSPAPVMTPAVQVAVVEQVVRPLLAGLRQKNVVYRGVLYAGLMITQNGPKVLEFNARFGDPECQPMIMRLDSDLLPLLLATTEGGLAEARAKWKEQASVCVVLASHGYPADYEKGIEITGLDDLADWPHGYVFHAGTVYENNRWLTNGGRVLGVTALGDDLAHAVRAVYAGVNKISWQGMHYRRDIAARVVGSESP